jgi:LDH2 family malate/lactate/ureidoglycolate dehydrogenase
LNVSVQELSALTFDVLKTAGVPAGHARIQADALLEAELRGHPSHGVLRVRTIVERIAAGVIDPEAVGTHNWRGEAALDVDGGDGLGPVVAGRALDAVAERARRTGVAVAALRRTNHLGMLALYVERAARAGQVAIATCTSEALVHPWGGREALVGTNPLAIGVPGEPDPLVLDMSTGQVSKGRILEHGRRGRPLEAGWAIDATGRPAAEAATASAISPFGGAKGYALGLALEVLVASLTRTATGQDVHGTLDASAFSTKGDVLIVLDLPDPSATQAVSAYFETVRGSAPLPGHAGPAIPGDRAGSARARALREGVDVAERTLDELRSLLAQPVCP